MKMWNGKFNESLDFYEISPDYNEDGIFRTEDSLSFWWRTMSDRGVRALVEIAFTDGYNRRKKEEEDGEEE